MLGVWGWGTAVSKYSKESYSSYILASRPTWFNVFFSISLCVWLWGKGREGDREKETRLPQQLCHYVGGNYESDENGEGERTGAKKEERKKILRHWSVKENCQLDSDLHLGDSGTPGSPSDEKWWKVVVSRRRLQHSHGWVNRMYCKVGEVAPWLQSNASSSSLSSSVATCQPSYIKKNEYTKWILTPNCICQTDPLAYRTLTTCQEGRARLWEDSGGWEQCVTWVLYKFTVFFLAPQVLKTGPVITCMAGCYFYTGGWAASCLLYEASSAFH